MRNFSILAVLALPLLVATGSASADPLRNFKSADADKSGSLEAPEFRNFIDLLADGGNRMARTVRASRAYGIALSRVDYNNDGRVSGDELKRYDKAN